MNEIEIKHPKCKLFQLNLILNLINNYIYMNLNHKLNIKQIMIGREGNRQKDIYALRIASPRVTIDRGRVRFKYKQNFLLSSIVIRRLESLPVRFRN